MTSKTLQRTPSGEFFARLSAAATLSPSNKAKGVVKDMLAAHFSETTEQGLLDKAEGLLIKATTLAVPPPAPAPAPSAPAHPLLQQLGAAKADAAQLQEQTSVAGCIAGAMMPLVLASSKRARLVDAIYEKKELQAMIQGVCSGVVTGLRSHFPHFEINETRLQNAVKEAYEASCLYEGLVLATASRLSEKCIVGLGNSRDDSLQYLEIYNQKVVPELLAALVKLDESAAATPLSGSEEATLRQITELFKLCGINEALQFLDDDSVGDAQGDALKKHCRVAFVRLWHDSGLDPIADRLLRFYRTPEGKEYLQHKQDIDASVNTDLRRAHLGAALSPIIEEASAKASQRRTEDFATMMHNLLEPLTTGELGTMLENEESQKAFLEGFTTALNAALGQEDERQ